MPISAGGVVSVDTGLDVVYKVNVTQTINAVNFLADINCTGACVEHPGGTAVGAPYPGQRLIIVFEENATGGFSVAFGSSIVNPCSVNTAASTTTICSFVYDFSVNSWVGWGGNTISGSSLPHCDDGVTTAGTVTCSEPFVASSLADKNSTQYELAYGGGPSSPFGYVPDQVTGDLPIDVNGGPPQSRPPGIPEEVINGTPYVEQCDISTSIMDRKYLQDFQSGASSVVFQQPDTSVGCGNFFAVFISADTAITLNRAGGATFTFRTFDGSGSSHSGLTSVSIGVSHWAIVTNGNYGCTGATCEYEVLLGGSSGTVACAGLPALTGDTTSSAGSCGTTTGKVNGGAPPTSSNVGGWNSSGQPINEQSDLGSITYNASGTTTFAAASAFEADGKVTTTASTSTTLSPTGLVKWGTYTLEITNASGSAATMTLGTAGSCSAWKVGGGGSGAITLSGSSAIDVLVFKFDGTNCVANFRANFN